MNHRKLVRDGPWDMLPIPEPVTHKARKGRKSDPLVAPFFLQLFIPSAL